MPGMPKEKQGGICCFLVSWLIILGLLAMVRGNLEAVSIGISLIAKDIELFFLIFLSHLHFIFWKLLGSLSL